MSVYNECVSVDSARAFSDVRSVIAYLVLGWNLFSFISFIFAANEWSFERHGKREDKTRTINADLHTPSDELSTLV